MSSGISIRIDRTTLAAALDALLPVVPSGGALIHQQLQLSAKGDRLTLAVTAPDRAKIASVGGAVVGRAGKVVLPAKRFAECVKTAPDGELELVVIDGATAQLSVGPVRYTLALYTDPEASLPPIQAEFHAFDGPPLADALTKVRYAAGKEITRPHYMQIEVSGTHVTASDGARVARVEHDSPLSFAVPVSALDDVLRVLRTGPVRLGVSSSHLIFQAGTTVLLVAQLNQNFPDVEKQLLRPTMINTDRLEVDRTALQDAIRRARINADSDTSAVVLVALKNQGLRVEARDKLGNSVFELIPATWTVAERRFILHHKLLAELLASSTDPTCTLLVAPDSTRPSPVLMRGADGVVGLVQSTRLDLLR